MLQVISVKGVLSRNPLVCAVLEYLPMFARLPVLLSTRVFCDGHRSLVSLTDADEEEPCLIKTSMCGMLVNSSETMIVWLEVMMGAGVHWLQTHELLESIIKSGNLTLLKHLSTMERYREYVGFGTVHTTLSAGCGHLHILQWLRSQHLHPMSMVQLLMAKCSEKWPLGCFEIDSYSNPII